MRIKYCADYSKWPNASKLMSTYGDNLNLYETLYAFQKQILRDPRIRYNFFSYLIVINIQAIPFTHRIRRGNVSEFITFGGYTVDHSASLNSLTNSSNMELCRKK
ncbi:hypothetical protein OESDEN_16816 [Oesophagostomum dentatum]|uniref:Uncharacterized protein n=1 Tax=Oesophagostomum dentatum TaxID=61180 RepID=A0A0B1SHW5_OESDE|nr:hypothetical protein OESDEN_16816 [Oesophagostomum dentatum]